MKYSAIITFWSDDPHNRADTFLQGTLEEISHKIEELGAKFYTLYLIRLEES